MRDKLEKKKTIQLQSSNILVTVAVAVAVVVTVAVTVAVVVVVLTADWFTDNGSKNSFLINNACKTTININNILSRFISSLLYFRTTCDCCWDLWSLRENKGEESYELEDEDEEDEDEEEDDE